MVRVGSFEELEWFDLQGEQDEVLEGFNYQYEKIKIDLQGKKELGRNCS